jgi:hypothetical protein
MKKLAIGCLVIVVVAGAVLAGVGYYGYMKVKSTVAQLAELGKIGDIEKGVKVKTPFAPPESGALTQKEVSQLVQIQGRIHDRLGQNVAAFQRNYQALAQKKDATVVDLPQILSAYRDLASTWLDAKRAQVDALNEAGISLDEYRWVKAQAYRALDVPYMEIDFSKLADQVRDAAKQQSGEAPLTTASATSAPQPSGNKTLVEPHRKSLEDFMALASFGL